MYIELFNDRMAVNRRLVAGAEGPNGSRTIPSNRLSEFHHGALEFFTNSPQYKNVNIANFVLALSLKIKYSHRTCNLEI